MPQYRRPDQTAIAAEYSGNHYRLLCFAQDSGSHRFINGRNQLGRRGKPTAYGNDGRAGYVDDCSQRIGNQLKIGGNCPSSLVTTGEPILYNLMAGCIGGIQKSMQPLNSARAANGIDTTALPTAATEPWDVHSLSINFYGCVQYRAVSPFARQSALTSNQSTIDNQPAAYACAQHCTENNVMSFTGALNRFGKRQTIGIISRDDPALQSLSKFET